MFCQQCGLKLPEGAKFCSVCGTPVYSDDKQQLPPSQVIPQVNNWSNQWQEAGARKTYQNTSMQPAHTTKTSKKWIIPVVVVSSLFIICAVAVFGILLKNSAPFKSNDGQSSVEANVNFDLSQYQSHGEYNSGLIWVEKTTSSYDQAQKTQFAYFDADGNQVSQWFSSSDYAPADFSNGLVCIHDRTLYDHGGYNLLSGVYGYVYDTSFNEIARVYCRLNEYYSNGRHAEVLLLDANQDGEVYAIGFLPEDYNNGDKSTHLIKISKDEIIKFDISSNQLGFGSLNNLKRIKRVSDYYLVDIRDPMINYPQFLALFDTKGRLVLNPSEKTGYTVYSISAITPERFKIMFEGKDDKYYYAEIDLQGSFLTEPTQEE